jgi:hypothetical protein
LWESRYFAPVFFILPVALLRLLPTRLLPGILLFYCTLCLMRLYGVEYPKIEERKQVLQQIALIQRVISNQPKPSLFVEEVSNKQSQVFGLLGNVYVRYPETRTKLFFVSDSTVTERRAYFERLSDWHYPLGMVSKVDSAVFHMIGTTEVRP